jgi:hypothetical protein
MQKLTYTVLIMLLLIAHNSFAGRIGANIALRPNITFQLNKVLLSSENLRIALLNQDEDQIEICLKELSWEVDQARNISLQVRDFDRRHLLKILDNIKGSLEISFSSFGGDRRELLLKSFNQMANIVRIYQVDPRFSIFYCPKDHATWIQASNKPQNPFRGPASASKDCGIKVNRQN